MSDPLCTRPVHQHVRHGLYCGKTWTLLWYHHARASDRISFLPSSRRAAVVGMEREWTSTSRFSATAPTAHGCRRRVVSVILSCGSTVSYLFRGAKQHEPFACEVCNTRCYCCMLWFWRQLYTLLLVLLRFNQPDNGSMIRSRQRRARFFQTDPVRFVVVLRSLQQCLVLSVLRSRSSSYESTRCTSVSSSKGTLRRSSSSAVLSLSDLKTCSTCLRVPRQRSVATWMMRYSSTHTNRVVDSHISQIVSEIH